MSKRLKIEITMWLILLFTLSQKGFSQILNCYEHFLEGRYHQAIQCFTKVTTDEELQNRWGEAFYYIGASHYNLFLSDLENPNETELMNATNNLEKAINPGNITTLGVKFKSKAYYVLGWCYFRFAEMAEENEDAISNLEKSFNYFNRVVCEVVPADSEYETRRNYSFSMKADINLRRVLLERSKFATLAERDISPYITHLNDAKSFLDSVEVKELKSYKDYLKLLSEYELGKFYENVSGKDSLALPYFNVVMKTANEQDTCQLYLKAMAGLNKSIITRSDINEAYKVLGKLVIDDEKYFRRGNLYQGDFRIENGTFFINEKLVSNYTNCRDTEKYYWLGWYYYLVGSYELAMEHFQLFIDSSDVRTRYLIDDAKLRKIDIEADITDSQSILDSLRKELSNLQLIPNVNVGDKNFIDLWIGIKRIGINALNSLTANKLIYKITEKNPRDAIEAGEHFDMVKSLNRKGVLRRNWIYFDVALKILNSDKISDSNKVNFYKILSYVGKSEMVKTTRAKQVRSHIYNLSVDDTSLYYWESQYLKGYAHYLDGDNASAIRDLQVVVDNRRNVRAAVYLAHAYTKRTQDNGLQRACYLYEAIRTAMAYDPLSYWYQEAEQGRLNTGCSTETGTIPDLTNALFLLTENGEEISYETLSKEEYLKKGFAKKMIKIWKLLSLPRLDRYPSVHKFTNTQFSSRTF